MQCDRCGKEHARKPGGTPTCAGHRSIKDAPLTPCLRYPEKGSDKCRRHGALSAGAGSTREQAIERNKARYQEQQLKDRLAALGTPIEGNPVEMYLNLIYVSAGMVEYLGQEVRRAAGGRADSLIWGTTELKFDEDSASATEKAGINIWLKLYNEERDRLAELTSGAIKVGIEERRLQLAEILGAQLVTRLSSFAAVLRAALERMGWDGEELDEVWAQVVTEAIPKALEEDEDEDERSSQDDHDGSAG